MSRFGPDKVETFAKAVAIVAERGRVDLRVLCPRGHYVDDLALAPVTDPADFMVHAKTSPRAGSAGVHIGISAIESKASKPDSGPAFALRCRRSTCSYRGEVGYFPLQYLCAPAVLAGLREIRMPY